MRSVDAHDFPAAHQHHQDGLRTRIGFVFCVFAEYTQTHTPECLRPMAVLAGLPRRNQAVALQSGGNRPSVSIHHGLNELAGSCGFAADPTCCPWCNVTLHTFHSGVWGIPISGEFRVHGVAGSATELGCLRVLNGTIGGLCPDKSVHKRGDTEKPSQTVQCGPAIKRRFSQSSPNTPLTQVDSDWNQC